MIGTIATLLRITMFAAVVLMVHLPHLITALAIKDGCVIKLNGGLPEPQPLFLLPDGSKNVFGFLLPTGTEDIINLALGDQVLLACPGGRFPALNSYNETAMATCCSGGEFCIGDKSHPLMDLKCSRFPYHTARSSGDTCYDGTKRHLEIGFEVNTPNNFYKLIDICFDDVRFTTLYSKFDLVSGIGGHQISFPRPGFIPDSFFGDIPINELYIRHRQREAIGNILGSEELGHKNTHWTATLWGISAHLLRRLKMRLLVDWLQRMRRLPRYIASSGDHFLARGHLTAKVDFVYGAQQRATFHYINVAPQWQTFNGGNWNALESSVRAFASKKDLDLEVFTGTYGTATLPNVNGVPTELYLYTDENNNHAVPVPAFYWKVLYHPVSQRGIAFIGLNNPYIRNITSEYILCEDVCSEVSWLTWDQNDITRGYSYCCEVDDFRAKVDVLPDFPVAELLK